jgi:hypothetical protein
MALHIDLSRITGLSEVWAEGDHAVVVVTNDGRWVRIIARQKILPDTSDALPFSAHYEQLAESDAAGRRAWVEADYPWVLENSAERCLRRGIDWVAGESA